MSGYDCKHGPNPCNRWETDGCWPGPSLVCFESKYDPNEVAKAFSVHPTITQEEFAKCETDAEIELNRILDENG